MGGTSEIMEKITVVSKSYEGNEWVKSFAQSGIPQINKQVISPWGLYTESLLTWGIEMPALPFESPVGIFIMLRILKENKGGYFSSASYRDAEIAYQAVQTLRNQYVGPVIQEAEEISSLLLPGILQQKNQAIIQELLLPYLAALKELGLWDLPALYNHFIQQVGNIGPSNKGSKMRRGKAILIEEDPLSPLEEAFVKAIYPENNIEKLSRDSIFSHRPLDIPGKKEIFKAYGSFNEWREVLDRIIQSGQPYDEFLIGSPQEQKIAHFMKEQNFVPYTLGRGIEIQCSEREKALKKREKQVLQAGFLEADIPGLQGAINDSLEKNRVDMANSQSGKIHLTQVNSLPLVYRKNVYIMGVEAYTGSQMENSILLDGDIISLRERLPNSDLRTSLEKTQQTIADFQWTVDLMIKQNRNITISYSYYDTAQLKVQAKPSAISPFESLFIPGEDAGYFSTQRIPLTEDEANAWIYYSGKVEGSRQIASQPVEGLGNLEKLSISATKAEALCQCPYKFTLENLLNMAVRDEIIDITRWLDPMQTGSLCHEIFAMYHQQSNIKATIDEDKVLMAKLFEQVLEAWLKAKPPVVDVDREIKEIKNLTENYVKLKNEYGKNNCVSVERLFDAAQLIPDKLAVYGKADLVEESSGKLTVIDVKTGRSVAQRDQDIKSCIQAILYCCLLEEESKFLPIKGGYYLYPRTQRIVSCDYNPLVKEQAIDLLDQALKSIETGDGWKVDDKKICKFCSFEAICKQEDKRRLFQNLVEEGVI